jgi:hypothetical protein
MFKFEKKTGQGEPDFWSLRVTKWFGLKIQSWDTKDNRGICFFVWYPKSKTRLGYASAWLPLNIIKTN